MLHVSGALSIVVAAAAISALLIVLLWQVFVRYALARPNARSSHKTPVPQGGGLAVIAATLLVAASTIFFVNYSEAEFRALKAACGAASLLVLVGGADDIRSIPVIPRLALQATAIGLVLAAAPADLRVFAELPWWIERALLLVGGVWFVNLVNFMDGIDWMTVAETVPICAGLFVLGIVGALPSAGTAMALALGGAMLGFAPFNRPVARLFLGDVGSLPIGLLLGWLLLMLASSGHLAAAILLPLYYLCDATITLFRRFLNGEPIWHAHRAHYYQQAFDGGASAMQIVGKVFVLNAGLSILAVLTVVVSWPGMDWIALAIGIAAVLALLRSFALQGR